eukprot:10291201-Ditylum_brightwellii.AAC.1
MGKQKELLNKSVSILNFISLKSDDDANVELDLAELNNAIEEMLEVTDSKKKCSKVTTTVNVAGACESKENVLKIIANFLTCWQCNYEIDGDNPPLALRYFL